jgi:hypothetical protein
MEQEGETEKETSPTEETLPAALVHFKEAESTQQ